MNFQEICTFSEYMKDNTDSLDKKIHIPYLIGSPVSLYEDHSFDDKNKILLPMVVLIKDEINDNENIEFKEFVFDWPSIDLLKTFSVIDQNGLLQYLGKKESQYKKLFSRKRIEVNIDTVVELTLDDVIEKYGFYRKLASDKLIEKYKNERFLLFKSKGKNYIVPSIEAMRFFYCFSEEGSLKKAIFQPNGMKSLVEQWERVDNSNRYNLYLTANAKTIDSKKIFYFSYNQNYLKMFNNVWQEFTRNKYISIEFPFEDKLKIVCDTLVFPQNPNNVLIINIVDSSMINTFWKDNGIELHKYHPHSQKKEKYTGKRDSEKDKEQKIPTKKPDKFNDRLNASSMIPPEIIDFLEEESVYFSKEEDTSVVEQRGRRQERGGRTKYVQADIDTLSTNEKTSSKDNGTQRAITSSGQHDMIEFPGQEHSDNDKEINDTSEIVDAFKKEGFEIISKEIFNFPDYMTIKGLSISRAISFIDKKMLIRRRYVFIHLSKNGKDLIYLDVEGRNDTKKEVLILINQKESIAHRSVYLQVLYGNHKWLTQGKIFLNEDTDFIRTQHRATPEKLVKYVKTKIEQ